jgi:RNA polymerase sigma-70 factor, ECF subfamily
MPIARLDMKPTDQSFLDWEAVYWERMPKIYNFFRYRLGDDALAEDLTATTFEKAWRFRERYRSDLGAFSTWLFTIARNVAHDHFRRYQKAVELDENHATSGQRPVEDAIQREGEFARLSCLLAQLTIREREIIALKYGAELTNRSIADVLGLSESNVGTIVHRVVQRLRAEWEVEIHER